ncbi:MAG: DNA repair photolyase [Paracoccaceae bacterium]
MLVSVPILFYIHGMELDPKLAKERRRGRGASTNQTNRFEKLETVAISDGWDLDEPLTPVRTEVRDERINKVITRNSSPDVLFEQSINPYRGCEHGCIYCFARPSHAFLGLSPGLDFETKLIAHPDAPTRLAEELAHRRYVPKVIAIGTNTDPYQPIEQTRMIMRGILTVLQAHQHPVSVTTKGTLIERDVDILGPMSKAGLARVSISVTTLNADLARKLEPRVPSPQRRLKAIETLAKAGCSVRVMVSPIIPGLTDHEIEAILQSAKDAGAEAASIIPLRLPLEVSPLFRDWLVVHFPDRAARVMNQVRDMHGGKDYDANWGTRMRGTGVYAQLIQRRFERAALALRMPRTLPPLRTDLFAVPPKAGDQMSLF